MQNLYSKFHNKYDNKQLFRGVVVFLVLATLFFLYCSWSSVLPVSECPDEEMRFDVPKFILDNGFLPRGDDPSIRNEIWGISYAFSVYGSSLVALPFMYVANLLNGSLASLYFAARVANNLMCVLTLFFVYRLGRKVGLHFISSLFAVILLGLWPQFAFLASYFNSEGLEFLSTVMVVFYAYSAKLNNFDFKSCIKWGLAIGVLAMSYYYAYGAIIASIIYYYGYATKAGRNKDSSKTTSKERYILKPLVIFLSAFLVAGWFFIRNAILYNGDFFGLKTSSQVADIYGIDNLKPESNRLTMYERGFSILSMFNNDTIGEIALSPWIVFTAKSSVGVFGMFTIYLSDKLYCAYVFLTLPALVIASLLLLIKNTKEKKIVDYFSVLLISIIPLIISVYYSYFSDWQPQGRYIMAGFPILALVVSYGWQTMFNKLCSIGNTSRNSTYTKKAETSENKDQILSLNKGSVIASVGFPVLIGAEILLASNVIENYIIPLLSSGIMDGLG